MKKCKDVKIMIDNKRLKLVPSYKYLGMMLDSTLNYSMHITSIVNVVSYKMQLLGKMRKYLNEEDRRFSTEGSHKLANVPFLKDRRATHVNNFMYIRKKNKVLLNNKEIRTKAHDAPLFKVITSRCESFKRSVGYFGATEWNNLPVNIRNIDNFLAFKQQQKGKMLEPLSLTNVNVNG